MEVEYLDLKTGNKAVDKGIGLFNLTESNWSCDCNRGLAFNINDLDDCRNERFIVINAIPETEEEKQLCMADIIRDANSDYI